jgi:2-keto-4-pentenoate hydratase/2-oxohepta-3-ene-1,7-dioic acid hydratase in catechol pathway
MKLLSYEIASTLGTTRRLGVLLPDGGVLDANLAYAHMLARRDRHPRAQDLADVLVPPDMQALIGNLRFGVEAIRETLGYLQPAELATSSRGLRGEKLVHRLDEIRTLAPLPQPRSIRDVVGFLQHIRNCAGGIGGTELPQGYVDVPAVYYKGNVMSVIGPDADVAWPPFGEQLDFELEVAAVIGRQGVDIRAEDAMSHIFGYTIFNDVSARRQQLFESSAGLGPTKGKDFDTGNIFGPWLVTPDEFDPREPNQMIARVNGEEWGRGRINEMDLGFAEMIAYISRHETLYPGDIICSGTVPTGCGFEHRRFLESGDVVELEVEGIGTLRNRFVGTPA